MILRTLICLKNPLSGSTHSNVRRSYFGSLHIVFDNTCGKIEKVSKYKVKGNFLKFGRFNEFEFPSLPVASDMRKYGKFWDLPLRL